MVNDIMYYNEGGAGGGMEGVWRLSKHFNTRGGRISRLVTFLMWKLIDPVNCIKKHNISSNPEVLDAF